MTDLVAAYNAMPKVAKDQIAALVPYFSELKRVRAHAELLTDRYQIKDKKVALAMAILDHVPTRVLLQSKFFDTVQAFDLRGNKISLESIIAKGERVRLIKGVLHGPNGDDYPVVVKWYKSPSKDTSFEINMYRELRKRKCPIAWISSGFFLHTSRVLVMEPLLPVTAEDNEFEMMIEVIGQLRYLHQFGVHSDLKPGNIMKRNPDSKLPGDELTMCPAGRKSKYLVIDYGGVSWKRLGWGYKRFCHTPRACMQPMHERNQITSGKYDLLELGVTAKWIQTWRTGEKQVGRVGDTERYRVDPYRSGFKGKLARYMDRAKKIDEKAVKEQDYEDLLTILRS